MQEDLVLNEKMQQTTQPTDNPFPYHMEKELKGVLDYLASGLDKRDIWILITGDEGSGKSNLMTYIAKYFSVNTGRKLDVNNIYFNPTDLINYAQDHDEKIIAWDEAAAGGLSSQWYTQAQINLTQFGMLGRIKKHIVIMCVPRFEKLKDYFIERSNMLIETYTQGNNYGSYRVVPKDNIKLLYKNFKKYKTLNVERYSTFHGYVPYVFNKVFTAEEQEIYTKNKIKAIKSIGKVKHNNEIDEYKKQLKEFKYKIGSLKFPIKTQGEFANYIGITPRSIQKWRYEYENNPINHTP